MESSVTDPYVRPDVAGFLAFLNNIPGPKMHQLEAPAARATYAAMKDIADPPVGELATITDLKVPGPAGDIPARLFDTAATRAAGPLVLFFHGGGFVIGDLDTHASFCAEISRSLDLPVLAVDYRLAPESPWPAAPDDCEAAARWAAASPEALGRSVTGLIVCGDSAGGNLAIVTAMALRDAPAAVPVIAQLPFYPATDTSREYPSYSQFADGFLLTRDSMEWFNAAYQAEAEHIRTSPLKGDLAGMPPAVVVTASLDPIRDQGRAYAAALAEAGVPVVFREAVGNIHGFITLRKAIPSSAEDVAGALAAAKTLIAEAL
ncbi:alpha/beta hydrolase [Sphingomonas sp. 10B4]|uniref:alpha/beta hydrolase n=1 Tax=Sphingomonas sp. 10B4 TaxID=3048575 RepID=UPI002AB56406|nr:alpha/beta hydrolase [Sphingomonas sp. 10B4]MDY7525238.1 alpha/beta hydrolase [Sphingomonas sp. 10B4]MEB0282063.1 alpha/beta hydrolase [Sphingomonas sp. 10B4]